MEWDITRVYCAVTVGNVSLSVHVLFTVGGGGSGGGGERGVGGVSRCGARVYGKIMLTISISIKFIAGPC